MTILKKIKNSYTYLPDNKDLKMRALYDLGHDELQNNQYYWPTNKECSTQILVIPTTR